MKIRVLPIVITGVALLLTLKAAGLMLTGHYAFTDQALAEKPVITLQPTYRPSAAARTANSWSRNDDDIITGSVPSQQDVAAATGAAEGEREPEAKPDAPTLEPKPEMPADLQDKNPEDLSSAEKALLDRLQSRREELEAREQELDLRENLLRAAEKKLDEQIGELKAVEDRLAAMEAARNAEDEQKIKDLVIMYENMKPKQAAAIFDRLDMKVLVDVTTKMNPKKTSDIIARMEPAAAERLTVALAKRDLNKPARGEAMALPKIGGENLKQP